MLLSSASKLKSVEQKKLRLYESWVYCLCNKLESQLDEHRNEQFNKKKKYFEDVEKVASKWLDDNGIEEKIVDKWWKMSHARIPVFVVTVLKTSGPHGHLSSTWSLIGKIIHIRND